MKTKKTCMKKIALYSFCFCLILQAKQVMSAPGPEKPITTSMHFVSQGQSLEMAYVYKKSGQPNAETVVLLHGKNFSATYWETTINFLTGKGYNVLAPDQIGFGKSTKSVCYQYSFFQLAINTRLLMDSLKISKAIMLGHSMGGMLAVRFALMYPEKCTKLILENPIGLEDWKRKVPYTSVDEEYKKELTKTREDLKNYMLKNYFHNEWKKEYEKILDENIAYTKQKDFSAYAKSMALTSDMIFTQPVYYEFSSLGVWVILIIGQADRTAIGKEKVDAETAASLGNYPALGKKMSAEIMDCELIEIDGVGHIPHVENFNLFSQSLTEALQKMK
jgi:pimeloyl-ACP methyl ester carboxylesterase